MNYNSISAIFSAGTSNMTVIRNNKKNDDKSDIIDGADWFTFNGNPVNKIYVNGNSFIGFGSGGEHLKVNRRDGALYSLYREEGTVYNRYKFLKIRWVGYSHYSKTTSSYALTYDVILWDTGDISLRMIKIPSSSNDGTYSLSDNYSTYAYTVKSSSSNVTFTKEKNGYTVSYKTIELIPFRKYLIRDNNTYYTVVDNALSVINVDKLTSNVFSTYGVEEVPPIGLTIDLSNPEILEWSTVKLNDVLVVHVTPPLPQIVYSDAQTIQEGSIIDKVVIPNVKNTIISITFDGGQTWKYYSENTWKTASSESEGMVAEEVQNIAAEQWAEVTPYTSVQFRCVLLNKESFIGKIHFNLVPTATEV